MIERLFINPRMAYGGGAEPEPETPGYDIPDDPGPKDFIGVDYRDNCGFFGEISANVLITPMELAWRIHYLFRGYQ